MEREKIKEYYSNEIEKDRLETDLFYLEGLRTKEIISRYLVKQKMNILDIGGGAGHYAFWLQTAGHNVSLIDLSPKNIELANAYAERTGLQLTSCETGDATDLKFDDNQFDICLLLGPLYHLPDKSERLKAITEAKRVLKPNGILLAATISRYASLLDGFNRDLVNDDTFYKFLIEDLKTGVHLNETNKLDYFTTAYFHTIEEIKNEITSCNLELQQMVAIESFGWFIDTLKKKAEDTVYMKKLLTIINMVETNEDLLAISPHMMTIARKK